MRSYVVRVVQRTGGAVLSLADLDANSASVLERTLGNSAIEELVRQVKTPDSWDTARSEAIGDALYRLLDGPAGWLETILAERSDVALLFEMDGALRGLPWELLHSTTFLCAHPHRLITPVHRLSSAAKRTPLDACNRPLRVLFMATSPEAVQPVLDFEREEARILDATKAQPIELIVEESGTLRGLAERLRDFGTGHFDVVHLSGHAGRVDERPCFFFEDDLGRTDPIFADKLARAFEAAWPRLLFLSGCRTGQAFEQADLPSLCEALVAAGAPAVLGWALPVGDDAASLAAEALYDRLGSGGRIDEAVAVARRKLFEERSTYWPLLRLYTDGTPLGALVTPKKTPGRAKRQVREARSELIEAGSHVEVCQRSAFVGRRRSIQRCLRVLLSREGDEGHAEGVLLNGLGGLGKTSLAARLCDRMPDHQRIVCVGRLDESDLLRALNARYPDAIKLMNSDLPLRARLQRVLEGPLEHVPALFVFDDFENNLERANIGAGLRPEALDVLKALVQAIRDACSDSRVIVTSRIVFALEADPNRQPFLVHEALESMRGADLRKKLAQLEHLGDNTQDEAVVRARAIALAAGNPRLLERLDRVLANRNVDLLPILAGIQAVAEEFREEIFLGELLAQQDPACRRMLAQLSVVRLPVDREAVGAIVTSEVEPQLARAVEVGLVEIGIEPETALTRYAVSGVVEPALADFLSDEERIEAYGRAARWLCKAWGKSGTEVRALELIRVALVAQEKEIATLVLDTIASNWIGQSRFREIAKICGLILELGIQYQPLYWLARAEEIVGARDRAKMLYEQALAAHPGTHESSDRRLIRDRAVILDRLAMLSVLSGQQERASQLSNEALVLVDKIGDKESREAFVYNMACASLQMSILRGTLDDALVSQVNAIQFESEIVGDDVPALSNSNAASLLFMQGKLDQALERWTEALTVAERSGDMRGQSIVLNGMGHALFLKGNAAKSLLFMDRALAIAEEIGDVQTGRAVLNHLALVAKMAGDVTRSREINRHAANWLVRAHAWSDLAILIQRVAKSDVSWSRALLAQAVWLTLHVATPFEKAITACRSLVEETGPTSALSPLVAMVAFDLAQEFQGRDRRAEKAEKYFAKVLACCAKERGIVESSNEQFKSWISQDVYGESPVTFRAKLIQGLELLVPDDAWLFNRVDIPQFPQFQP
jgi:tetratricopeptide (TPR) repeat protein/CHAT domain-containing protein